MPPRPEQFSLHRQRDEDDGSSSGGKGVRYNRIDVRNAKRSGELLPLPEVPLKLLSEGSESEVEASESFDPTAYFETAKKAYIELGRRVQKIGIEPKEIVQVWESADATLDEIKNFSKEYTEETNPGKREEIAMLMQRLGTSLDSHGRVSDQIEDAARGFRNEKREETPLAMTKPLSEKEKEEALGQVLGHDIWNILSEPKVQIPEVVPTPEAKVNEPQLSKIEKPIPVERDVDVSRTQTPQYMPRQRREGLQEEINNLGHTPETASMAIANQNFEQLHQIETKPGLATEWQKDAVPLGRVMPRMVLADTEPLVQVETKSPEVVLAEETKILDAAPEHLENISSTEGTPLEWRNKLRGLIEGAKENFGISERFSDMKKYFANRLKDLDAQVK